MSTAPPQLHNIAGCFGEEQDKCTLAQNAYIYTHSRYYINVSFDGNGPFQVDWYHNGTKFSCATFKFCEKIEKGSTYQVLRESLVAE